MPLAGDESRFPTSEVECTHHTALRKAGDPSGQTTLAGRLGDGLTTTGVLACRRDVRY